MIKVTTMNGRIELAEQKKLIYAEGRYVGYLYVTVVNDRFVCDSKLNRDQVKSLIAALEASLLWT